MQEGAEHGATQAPYTNIGRGTECEHVGPAGDFEPKLHRDNDSYEHQKYSKPINIA